MKVESKALATTDRAGRKSRRKRAGFPSRASYAILGAEQGFSVMENSCGAVFLFPHGHGADCAYSLHCAETVQKMHGILHAGESAAGKSTVN
jgi:hypothetical protein